MIGLKNEFLSVAVSPHGAELQSIRCAGQEYLWQGDPAFWRDRAPVLFPVCGSLRDDRYTLDGTEYRMPKHGFAKHLDFEAEYHDGTSAVFLAEDTEDTRACFPFSFQLRVSYQLTGRKIRLTYDVLNRDEKTAWFAIGAHEGYALPEGLSEYRLVFPQEEQFQNRVLADGGLTTEAWETIAPSGNSLSLTPELFAPGTLVFDRLRSRSCVLCRKDGGRAVRVSFEDFRNLLIWTVPGAKYVCLEPWSALPDPADHDYDITHKPGVISAWPNETVTRTHTLEILA